MGINFPSSPANGATVTVLRPYGAGPVFSYSSGAWRRAFGTALPTNKLVNPTMQISQENGLNQLVCLAGYQYYAADQWVSELSGSLTTAQIACGQFAIATPKGAKYRNCMVVSTAQASLAATDFAMIRQSIEGNRIADLAWGTVNAKWAVLQFGFRGPAGTYTAFLRNTNGRTYLIPFTVSAADANRDQYYSFAIPPCFDGTWVAGNTLGLQFGVSVIAAASTQGTPNFTWLSNNTFGATSMTNNIAVVNSQFHLFDVGLHADPLMTGVAPEFQAPSLEDDLQDCLRYWYKTTSGRGVVNTATTAVTTHSHFVPMRIAPAYAVAGGNLRGYDGGAVASITGIGTIYANTTESFQISTTFAAATVGRGFNLLNDNPGYITVSARM